MTGHGTLQPFMSTTANGSCLSEAVIRRLASQKAENAKAWLETYFIMAADHRC